MKKAFLPLLLLLLASCSVKEARDSCPCRVEIDLTAFSEISRSVRVGLGENRRVRALTAQDSLHLTMVIRQQASVPVSVRNGLTRMEERGDTLRVPPGAQCDSLYLFLQAADASGDRLRLHAVPHKQFATVFLYLQGGDGTAPESMACTVRSDCSGLDSRTGQAVGGTLSIGLSGAQNYAFRLPRQRADSRLVLEASGENGVRLSYPLGEWILDGGYDWDAPDLDDVAIGLDLWAREVVVRVLPWESGSAIRELF